MEALAFEARKQALLKECNVAPQHFSGGRVPIAEISGAVRGLVGGGREQVEHVHTFVQCGLLSDLEHRNVESIAYFPLWAANGCRCNISSGCRSGMTARCGRNSRVRQIGPRRELGAAGRGPCFRSVVVSEIGLVSRWACGSAGNGAVGWGRLRTVRSRCSWGMCRLGMSTCSWTCGCTCPGSGRPTRARMRESGGAQRNEVSCTRPRTGIGTLGRSMARRCHINGSPATTKWGRPAWFPADVCAKLHEQYLLAVPSNTSIRDLEVEPPVGTGRGRPPKRPWQKACPRGLQAQPASAWIQLDVRDAAKGPLVVELLKRRVRTRKREAARVSRRRGSGRDPLPGSRPRRRRRSTSICRTRSPTRHPVTLRARRRPNIASRNAQSARSPKRAWRTTKSGTGSAGITIKPCP